MASIPGRPYKVGFTFRIIAAAVRDPADTADTADSAVALNVMSVMEYHYNNDFTIDGAGTQRLPSTPYELASGSDLEFTANAAHEDRFVVVTIECSDRCEVRIVISIFCILLLF